MIDIDKIRVGFAQARVIDESLKDFDDTAQSLHKSYATSLVTEVYRQEQHEVHESIKVDAVERLIEGRTYGMLTVPFTHHGMPDLGTTRLRYSKTGSELFVLPNTDSWDLSHREPPLLTFKEEGIKFAPDLTVMFREDGQPELTHTGTGSLFDLLRKERDLDVDCYVIRFGEPTLIDEDLDLLVEAHRKSSAPITALVTDVGNPHDNRPILVRTDKTVGLYDPRDLVDPPAGQRLVEAGVYVVSSTLLGTSYGSFHWTWRRRRYHVDGRIWFQLERDMCELTQLFVTNYVRT